MADINYFEVGTVHNKYTVDLGAHIKVSKKVQYTLVYYSIRIADHNFPPVKHYVRLFVSSNSYKKPSK